MKIKILIKTKKHNWYFKTLNLIKNNHQNKFINNKTYFNKIKISNNYNNPNCNNKVINHSKMKNN
jgi:hypothetical protein